MANQKKSITLLPGYLQSENLRKVFSATVDHLFQESDIEFLNGYIGYKPIWYDNNKDVYVNEPDATRTDYQLTPATVSVDYLSGQVTNAMFYDDLLGALRFQGANVSNPNRLFSAEYYSWSPPIDIDKFVNFGSYYWLPTGPAAILLLDITDLYNSLGETSYVYTGSYQLSSTGETFSGTINFQSGLKIKPTRDKTLSYNNKEFYVEGIGRSFTLVPNDENFNPAWDIFAWDIDSWDGDPTLLTKQYVTIGRGAPDGNTWSYQNKWFHQNIISLSQTYIADRYGVQALRPIIEFDAGLVLYNYGRFNRGIIDICDVSTADFLGTIVGQPSYSIQNIPLQDGMRILVTADIHPDTNNRIYIVSGVAEKAIQFTLDKSGKDETGAPFLGDRAYIRFGINTLERKNIYFDGKTWTTSGQQKTLLNPPLFSLYDTHGNSMDDPSVYPYSNFKGSKVFSYQTDDTYAADLELGIPVKLDQFGDYIFENNLSTDQIQYNLNNKFLNYVGDLFAELNGLKTHEFVNGWWKSKYPSKQYIVNNYILPESVYQFQIDQNPAARDADDLPTIYVYKVSTLGKETLLLEGIDYTVNNRLVKLVSPALTGERVIIKTWNRSAPQSVNGYYEIPKNLSSNPNNLPVTSVSRSQILQHFVEIIQNQNNFNGSGIGSNNYKDSAQNRSFGQSILQHRAPLLKLALLNSSAFSDIDTSLSITDPMLAMEYAQSSYTRFYNRFVQTLLNINKSVKLTGSNTPTEWINMALSTINVGKTADSPWSNSGPTSVPGQYCSLEQTNPTWVPATPARLGIMPSYQPMVYYDTSYLTPKLTIQTHDGSRIIMTDDFGYELGTILHNQTSTTNPTQLSNPVAAAWLQFELNLFNSLPARYKNVDYTPVFDIRTFAPGKWRDSEYSRIEFISLLRGAFDKWTITSQVDYTTNTGYDTDNQFSFNYRSVNDTNGNPIPGHWQGIYRWYYDTDRPHISPWEMLGFSIKPSWWDNQYGPAPYTSGNTAMWEDLRDGRIRQGERAGIYKEWSRPGLMSCIPVDSQGRLQSPYYAGCVRDIPSVADSKSEWIFGDGGPIESVWINSIDYKFTLAKTAYLMNPARFVEYNWDTLRTEQIYSDQANSQWIYIDTNNRRSSQQFYVHREKPSLLTIGTTIPNETDLSYFGSCGFQHWISEYLVSKGFSVTNYFGNIIRGGDVKLAHRMAGFTPTDSFRALVDSFGQIGYSSRLIPNENINIHLYKSTSIGESVYSGVIIEQVANGWKVRGYDSINPSFIVIPSDPNGDRISVVIGNQRVTEFANGLDKTARVLYGTVFNTRQQVYDFLIGYSRWLENQGWIFKTYDGLANDVNDWSKSAKEFLFWSQGNWDNGTFITVSPAADSISFAKQYGNIQYVNGIVSGTYPVLDRIGQPIQQKDVSVIRNQNGVTIRSKNDQGIFLVRLFRNTLEHAVFFDNLTAFNDVIYQPLFGLYQERILIYAYRAKGWNGRVDIPGYIVVQNTTSNTWNLTSNFDKSADDFMKFFNIEQPTTYTQISPGPDQNKLLTTELGGVDTSILSKLAKHLIGYQNRNYLQNLLLDDATEFEFYQGFIRQKGTQSTINSLLRNSSIIPAGSAFQYYEEWLFRTAYYGGLDLNSVIEFILPQDTVTHSPQQIRLFTAQNADVDNDAVFDIVPNDPLIVTPPNNYQDPLFVLRTSYDVDPKTDLPSAGYALLGEPTYYVKDEAALLTLFEDQQSLGMPLAVGNTVWQFITSSLDWTVWRVSAALTQIAYTTPSSITGEPTIIVTADAHGLVEGDICIIFGILGAPEINGTFAISNVTSTSFSIDLSTFQQGSGGTVWFYTPTRFKNIFDRDSYSPPTGWINGDIAYVDEGGITPGAWTVYKYLENNWIPVRQQEYKINASLVLSSELYDSVSKNKVTNIDYFDPAKGRISGKADAEITYKTDYDPAKYNSGNNIGYAINVTESWGNAQLGQVWWDLTTTRYIDYDQGDDTYKITNWGKLAPGTSVDVYEWIRSPIPPSDWASYVAQGSTISVDGFSFIPSGSVRNPASPNWSEYVETNTEGTNTTYYYFWVKNSAMSPIGDRRQLTTEQISNLITSPSVGDIPWFAAISQRSIILGNVTKFLNANDIIQRIRYTNLANNANTFNEWQLLKQGDPYSQPDDYLWQKLKASLVTFDGLQNDVPNYHLTDLQKYGNFIRPRQTWFNNRVAASKLFVDTVNALISATATPLVDDSAKINWTKYFMAEEPQPPSTEWSYHVTDLGQRDGLIGAITPGQYVLVDAVSITNNKWTLWQYTGTSDPWNLVRVQYYKVTNYWKYVDWYAYGYNATTSINLTVDTIFDLEVMKNMSAGTVVKVLDNGSNKWQIYIFANSLWYLIGQQDGSIEILPTIYNWDTDFGGFDGQPFDYTPMDQIAGEEFSYIIDGIKNAIFFESNDVEINDIFFAMVQYVLSEQGQVDWAIKTSNISLKGFKQPLYTYKLLPVDLTDSIIGFLNESKPYHVKISELVIGKTAINYASVRPVDFDLPPNFNPSPPPNDGTLAWYIWNSTYESWKNNYKTNPNLIRTLKTRLIFDRIATPGQRMGWGSSWDVYGWSNESTELKYGAIDRIDQYYSPSSGMIPKIISELMIGVEYRSTILENLALNMDIGWSVSPWDSGIAWDPTRETINEYLDLIIQGGQIPRYDTAVGNGMTTTFNLLYPVKNPLDMVVWSDGKIRSYDTDWIVKTHAERVYVVQGGINYSVGDQLVAIAGSGLAEVRLLVTAVNHGSITGLTIIGNGSYRTVTKGPYHLKYPSINPGQGTDALVEIDWSCDTITFSTPPLSSNEPNIYILYVGTTFEPAPTETSDTIYSGSNFIMPHVDVDHPEELYPSRIKDTLMLDTYVNSVGGRPLVATRVYESDGIRDQYDIGIRPENNVSIFVYLDGVLQKEGLTEDYVINFATNRVVFLTPPSTGILRITSIGAGGGSRSVNGAYVVNGGIGYSPGDLITLAGGVGQPAQIKVTGVAAANAVVISSGTGYNVGESLTLKGGTLDQPSSLPGAFNIASVKVVSAKTRYGGSDYLVNDLITVSGPGFVSNLVVKVSNVDINGATVSFNIIDSGEYILPNAPTKNIAQTTTSGNGYGALLDLSWGVKSVNNPTLSIYSSQPSTPTPTDGIGQGAELIVSYSAQRADIMVQGIYTRPPDQPVSQFLVLPAGGTGSTWNLKYTKRLNEYLYYGDGIKKDFSVPGTTISYPAGLLVTLDGDVMQYTTKYTRITDGIRFVTAPTIGQVIIINTFEAKNFSTIEETSIDVTNPLTLSYKLSNAYPMHSMPYFVTTLVRQNGLLMQPPVIQTWFGNGYTREFNINVDITTGTILYTQIYIDSKLMVNGSDYSIDGDRLKFAFSPPVNSEIILLCVKSNTQYTLSVVGGYTYINFASGSINLNDNILVTTYAEDADYNFATEEFVEYGNGWSVAPWDITSWSSIDTHEYILATTPYDLSTVSVWVNGQYLTPIYDYIVEQKDVLTGWDTDPWDLVSWASTRDTVTVVRLGDHVAPNLNSPVTVSYMVGLPERPPVAWRTLISDTQTISTAIDNERKTAVLSNVFVTSTTIEIEDVTKISSPHIRSPQFVYINDEMIGYYEIQQAPTPQWPNRGYITNLIRNANGTSSCPIDKYAVLFYNGNGEEQYFATEAVGEAISETVWVDEVLQKINVDYTHVLNPPSKAPGRYVQFTSPPNSGYKNIKIVSLNANGFENTISHKIHSTVIDAGDMVRLPNGYMWEPNSLGIQYGKSTQSEFLLTHSGTRS